MMVNKIPVDLENKSASRVYLQPQRRVLNAPNRKSKFCVWRRKFHVFLTNLSSHTTSRFVPQEIEHLSHSWRDDEWLFGFLESTSQNVLWQEAKPPPRENGVSICTLEKITK